MFPYGSGPYQGWHPCHNQCQPPCHGIPVALPPGFPSAPQTMPGAWAPSAPPPAKPNEALLRRIYTSPSADARKAAVKEYVQIATNDTDTEPDATQLELIETWLADKDYEKEILGVLKERLDSGWPFNYKALLVCKKLKDGQAIDLIDKVTPLTKLGNTTQGAAHVRKEAKPLLDRATKAKNAKEKEEAEKRQAAIMAMWGGLWHDQAAARPATLTFPVNALPPGWTWPYSSNPPGYLPAASPWVGKGPEGWTGAKVAANEQNIPFSRTLFTAMKPEKPPDNKDGVILKTEGKGK